MPVASLLRFLLPRFRAAALRRRRVCHRPQRRNDVELRKPLSVCRHNCQHCLLALLHRRRQLLVNGVCLLLLRPLLARSQSCVVSGSGGLLGLYMPIRCNIPIDAL